jgi:hypothetical protein
MVDVAAATPNAIASSAPATHNAASTAPTGKLLIRTEKAST